MPDFLDILGLRTFLNQLKNLFATKESVISVEQNTDMYILDIDYENTLAFDTTEIITSEDVILEENESILLTTSDEILIDANDTYIIVNGGV